MYCERLTVWCCEDVPPSGPKLQFPDISLSPGQMVASCSCTTSCGKGIRKNSRWICSTMKVFKGTGNPTCLQEQSKLNQNTGTPQICLVSQLSRILWSPPPRASCNRGATCDYVCNRLTEAINNRKPPWSALFTVPLPLWHERDVERFRAKWSKNHANDPRNATNFQILGPIVNLAVLTKSHCLALGSDFRCFCVAHWCPWWWHAQQTFQPPKCVSWLIAQHKVSTALQSNST